MNRVKSANLDGYYACWVETMLMINLAFCITPTFHLAQRFELVDFERYEQKSLFHERTSTISWDFVPTTRTQTKHIGVGPKVKCEVRMTKLSTSAPSNVKFKIPNYST